MLKFCIIFTLTVEVNIVNQCSVLGAPLKMAYPNSIARSGNFSCIFQLTWNK